jgi:plastocyanin
MKKIILSVIFITMITGAAYSTQYTITNSGIVFTPDYLEINPGDTVSFELATMHNAVEVSEATWMAGDTTSDGGFRLPFGGGTVDLTTIGIHYYVCQPHASLGMKGRIKVLGPTDLPTETNTIEGVTIYPNPARDLINLAYTLNNTGIVSIKLTDITGKLVTVILNEIQAAGPHEQSYSFSRELNPGLYLIDISRDNHTSIQKLIIE